MKQSLKIAIFGAGNVGGALGRIWSSKGYKVTFGVPDPQNNTRATGDIPITTNKEAAAGADVVVLTVPWTAAHEAIRLAGDLSNIVLIDCTNAMAPDLTGLVLGTTTSAGEMVASWAPNARVVKAFNTIGAGNYDNAQFGSERADGFYCGNDESAKAVVKQLIEETQLQPVDVGPLKNARWLEAIAMLWVDLAINQKQGVDHGFKLLRR